MTLKLGMQHQVLEYYQVCSNDDPGLTLTYFTAKSNLVPYCFCMGKRSNNGFFRNYCSLRYQSWWMQSTKWVHEPLWISKIKVIHWPLSKVIQIQHFQTSFPQKTNQRTSGPVNAHLTPGPGIYFNAFIHVYSPRAGADNSLGTNVDVNRKPLSLCPFVASLKKEIWFYTHF